MRASTELLDHGRQFSTGRGEVECPGMIEDSPESFIARWRDYAAQVELFPHTEGSPLLEVKAGTALLQLFERTGPYLGRPGPAKLIIHPIVDGALTCAPEGAEPGIEATGVSSFQAVGRVVAVDGRMTVIDAGVPLVVAVLDEQIQGSAVKVGQLVSFSNRPPAHGFVLPAGAAARRPEQHHDDHL